MTLSFCFFFRSFLRNRPDASVWLHINQENAIMVKALTFDSIKIVFFVVFVAIFDVTHTGQTEEAKFVLSIQFMQSKSFKYKSLITRDHTDQHVGQYRWQKMLYWPKSPINSFYIDQTSTKLWSVASILTKFWSI